MIVRPVKVFPPPSNVTAVNGGVVDPATTESDVGEIVTLPTGIAVTVSVAGVLLIPSLVAVIDAVPGATPVATPVFASIVAIVGSLEANVTTRPASGWPPASFGCAVKAGVVAPTWTD